MKGNVEAANNDLSTLNKDIKSGTHVFICLLVALCLGLFLWVCFGKIDVASQAEGSVFPSSKIKSIQHLEGGIVQEILVKEGEKVKPGQPLVSLESTSSGADVEQLQVQITSLRLDIVRLKAETKEFASLEIPSKLEKQNPDFSEKTRNLYVARKKHYESQVTSQKEITAQRKHEVTEIQARLKNLKEALALADEQISISDELLKDELTNRYNHIDLLRESNSLQSKIEQDEAALKRLEAALKEEKSDMATLKNNFQEKVNEQLEEANRKLKELTKEMSKYADNLQRTLITSPVSGVVKEMFVFTKGGVVRPGETLLDIIPSGDQLIVDAKLPTQDIGYVRKGQSAVIRLASASGMRFDKLDGTVTFVSPDSIQPKNADEEPYYRVRLVTNRDYFKKGSLKYKLYPGVQVSVNILTGRRSIISYLLDPFFSSLGEGLQER